MEATEEFEKFADVRKHVPFLRRYESLAVVLERALSYPKVRRAFERAVGERNLFAGAARELDLKVEIEGLAEVVPKEGPVVVISNHAFGGADALSMMAALVELRPDTKVLANKEVAALPGVAPFLYPVNILEPGGVSGNLKSLRGMVKHVREGHSLAVFPAGRVAYWRDGEMQDPPWNHHVIALLKRMEATVVPLWFFGSPSPGINLLSKVSGFLRTALIPTGLAWMSGKTIRGKAGLPFSSNDLRDLGDEAGPWLRRKLNNIKDAGN